MKKFLRLASLGLAALAVVPIVSCSDDDDNRLPDGPNHAGSGVLPSLDKVFPSGGVSKVGNMTITRNAEGRPTRIEDGTMTVDFSYVPVSRATEYDMTMRIVDSFEPGDVDTYYLQLDKNGYIRYAIEVDDDGDYETYEFEYNNDGQMTKVRRTDDGAELTTITYANGDITAVKTESRNEFEAYTVDYTDAANKTPVANRGNLMFFDECFSIGLGDLEIAYYAGLLGTSTRNLPLRRTEASSMTREYETYDWVLDAAGKPTRLQVTDYDGFGRPQPELPIDIVW